LSQQPLHSCPRSLQATQQLPLARSAFRPQINLSADASLNDIDDDFSDTFSSTSLTLVLTQSIFNRSNAALLDQAGFGRAEAEVAFTGAELQAIGRQKDQAEKRFDVGLATVIDVRDAQAQFDLAVALEVAAVNAEATAFEALRVLTGVEPGKLDPLRDTIALVAPKPEDIETQKFKLEPSAASGTQPLMCWQLAQPALRIKTAATV